MRKGARGEKVNNVGKSKTVKCSILNTTSSQCNEERIGDIWLYLWVLVRTLAIAFWFIDGLQLVLMVFDKRLSW